MKTYLVTRSRAGLVIPSPRIIAPRQPSMAPWQQPTISAQPWTDEQKLSAAAKVMNALANPTTINRNISLFNPPSDSLPFIITPNPFPAYPAPGAAAVIVISYTVPAGLMAVINALAVVHVGGNPPDGTGQVVWNVLLNGAGINGLNQLTSQVGTYAQPNKFVIRAIENDIVQVTVQVPAGQPAMPVGTRTASRFHGWTYPLVQATQVSSIQSSGVLQ